MTITYDWEKIFAYVWNNELSKQELSNIGIDITDRKWRRLFGKSPNQANYFFCNKCKNRHTIVPLDPGKFLALDESEHCEREYQISEQDLQLFSFKKLAFIQVLQKHAFDLKRYSFSVNSKFSCTSFTEKAQMRLPVKVTVSQQAPFSKIYS